MKRSKNLQQKINDLAEKRRLEVMASYLSELHSKFRIDGVFVGRQIENISTTPIEYISSRKFLGNPIEVIDSSSASNDYLIERITDHLNKYEIVGEALFYLSSDVFGGEWVKIDKIDLERLVYKVVSNADLSKELEFLVACTGSAEILAFFEEEYEYLLCKFTAS